MQAKIIRKHEQVTSKWAGGTTMQLAIFPESAVYSNRDFLFRISTAKVEAEESEFTSLPGVSRVIMILDGTFFLNHEGHYSKTLQKFDTDFFDGSWKTSSKGNVTDFNLMTTGQATGKLFSRILQPNQTFKEPLFDQFGFVGFYPICGKMEVEYSGQKILLVKNDFMMINHENNPIQIVVKAIEYCEVAIAGVKLG
jgi:environmental stress-induced protein Ves